MSFWPWKRKDSETERRQKDQDKTAPSSNTLADIARGMQHAVNSTQHIVEHHYARMFERYFEEDAQGEKGKGKPIMKTFLLPDGKNEISVPLISLIPTTGLVLDELEVQMAVRIDEASCKAADPEHDVSRPEVTRTSFQVSFAPRKGEDRTSNMVDIRMKFKAGDPPEAVARIIEQFTHTLNPRPVSPPTPPPPAATS